MVGLLRCDCGPSISYPQARSNRTFGYHPPVTDVREYLRSIGISRQEIEAAEAQGPDGLRLLLLDVVLLQQASRYTQDDVAEMAGVPLEVARRFWTAMGFVEPTPDERIFNDADVEALRTARDLIEQQITHPLLAVQQTRVIGLSMARVAESAVAAWEERRVMPLRGEEDPNELEVDEEVITATQKLLESNQKFIVYIWRRHLAAAAKRGAAAQMTNTDEIPLRGIGFADLVGFTKIAQDLDEPDLAELVDWFETSAHDTITSLGGRLVKMIGDEVMFTADRPETIADVGLAISDRHDEDERLPPVRVGLAWGPVLAREGDYYGPMVNLANRLVKAARPGTVLVNDLLQEKLAEREGFSMRRVPAPPMKGIGRVRVWRLKRGSGDGSEPTPADFVEDAREATADLTEGTLARVSEAAEDALSKAALAVDEVIEKAALSATGKALRHRERKAKRKQGKSKDEKTAHSRPRGDGSFESR
jgi:adenylate cyclase